MFDIKRHHKAGSIQEALTLLKANPEARLIAGGTDILIKLHKGKAGYDHLVDIHDVAELNFISEEKDGRLRIGPGCTFRQIIESPVIQRHIPILAEAVANIGGPQVRNMATIGGNICNGVPSCDSGSSLLALNAVVTIAGPKGDRQLPIENFFLGPGRVAVARDEILAAITIAAADYQGYGGFFYKYAMRRAMDIATIGCAAVCKVDGDTLVDLRLAYQVAAPVPIRCPKAEKSAVGQKISETLLEKVAAQVVDDVTPRTSWRASRELRLQIIRTLARRSVRQAVIRAGGTGV